MSICGKKKSSSLIQRDKIIKDVNLNTSKRSFKKLLRLQVLHHEDVIFRFDATRTEENSHHSKSVSFRSTNLFTVTRKIINRFVKNSKYDEVTGNMYLLMPDKSEKTLKFRIRKTHLFSKCIYLVIFDDNTIHNRIQALEEQAKFK